MESGSNQNKESNDEGLHGHDNLIINKNQVPVMLKEWHRIIHNQDDIKKFGDVFKVDKRHLALCVYLTMRRKYYPKLSQGTTIFNRVMITGGSNFETRLYQNILRLETPIGSYTDGDIIIPDESTCIICYSRTQGYNKSNVTCVIKMCGKFNRRVGRITKCIFVI